MCAMIAVWPVTCLSVFRQDGPRTKRTRHTLTFFLFAPTYPHRTQECHGWSPEPIVLHAHTHTRTQRTHTRATHSRTHSLCTLVGGNCRQLEDHFIVVEVQRIAHTKHTHTHALATAAKRPRRRRDDRRILCVAFAAAARDWGVRRSSTATTATTDDDDGARCVV